VAGHWIGHGQTHESGYGVILSGVRVIFFGVRDFRVINPLRINLPLLGFRFESKNDFYGNRNGFWALEMGFVV
jgi:hypothetical protein